MAKSELEDKVFKLKELNKTLKEKEQETDQKLKKAQWEASYFRQKWSRRERTESNDGQRPGTAMTAAESAAADLRARQKPKGGGDRGRTSSVAMRERTRRRVNAPHIPSKRGRRGRRRAKGPSDSDRASEEAQRAQDVKLAVAAAMAAERERIVDENRESDSLSAIRAELKAKQSVLDSLTLKYREMASNLAADRLIQKRALLQCQRYKELLRQKEEDQKERECNECDALRTERESLRLFLANLQHENRSLEERVGRLTAHSVLGDELESERMAELTATHRQKIGTMSTELSRREDDCQRLREGLKAAERERDRLREETAALKAESAAMAVRSKLFEDESGIDLKDLECALDLISRSEAMDSNGSKEDDPVVLRAKIEDLQIANRDLVVECTQNQNLLESQIDLNKKMEKDFQRLSSELDAARREQKERTAREITDSAAIDTAYLRSPHPADSPMFTASAVESLSYRTTENVLSLRIESAELDPNVVPLPSLSMLIVDFFHFHSIPSPQLVAGHHPKYQMLCQFTLKMDPFLLHFLSSTECLRIHFVQKTKAHSLSVVATASLSLRHLLNPRGTATTHSLCHHKEVDLLSVSNKGRAPRQRIGSLSLSAQFLRSITGSKSTNSGGPHEKQEHSHSPPHDDIDSGDDDVILSEFDEQ